MELPQALAQIAEIRDQVARTDVYRGYRSVPVAACGAIGLVAAWFQPDFSGDPAGFVIYWMTIAVCAGFVGVSEIVYNYIVHDESAARRRTRRVVGQLLPSLLGGAVITLAVLRTNPAFVTFLPGIWSICFGIGIFASRTYLVRPSGWVAVYYYAAGAVLLWFAGPVTLTSWAVGLTFGVGQLMTAAVLYWSLEHQVREERSERADGSTRWHDEHDEY